MQTATMVGGRGTFLSSRNSRCWVAAAVVAVLLALLGAPSVAAQAFPTTLHVNADTGSDFPPNDGSAALPFKTLNKALQVAYDTNPQGGGVVIINKIKVYWSSTPIAPENFGGCESFGWTENPLISRPPLPIRMQPGVDIIGIRNRVTQARPVITINELAGSLTTGCGTGAGGPYTNWPVGEERAMVNGASGAVLSDFVIDGSKLISSASGASNWPGVRARNVINFQLIECEVFEWHDQVFLHADAPFTNRATIRDCNLHHAWPLVGQLGHAALWLVGNGTHETTIIGTTFDTCHDGLEIAGEAGTLVTLTMSGCTFSHLENGLEIVGDSGVINTNIDNACFIENYSKGTGNGGTVDTTSLGSILVRRPNIPLLMAQTNNLFVRDCDFRNNGYGIVFNTAGGFDLGTDANPGNNNFCIDFSLFPAGQDPYRVQLYDKLPNVTGLAAKNFWIRDNQGANGSGHITIGTLTAGIGGVNLWSIDPFTMQPISPPAPPGPKWGVAAPGPFPRNYSMEETSTIDFGLAAPAGLPPDCTAPPTCP